MLKLLAAFLLLMQGVCAVARGGVICLGGADPDCLVHQAAALQPTDSGSDCCHSSCHNDETGSEPLLVAIHADSSGEDCVCHVHVPVPEPEVATIAKADRTGADSQWVAAPALAQITAPIDARPMTQVVTWARALTRPCALALSVRTTRLNI